MTKRKRILHKSVREKLEWLRVHHRSIPQYHTVMSPVGTEFVINTVDVISNHPIEWPEEFYIGGANRTHVYNAIDEEREYQLEKFGHDKEQSLPGFLVIIQNELNEAYLGWAKNLKGRNSALHEIRQIAATCVAAMEKYGVEGNAISTDDIPTDER